MLAIDEIENALKHPKTANRKESLEKVVFLKALHKSAHQLLHDLRECGEFKNYDAASEMAEVLRNIDEGPPRRVYAQVSFLARGELSDVKNLLQENIRPIPEFVDLTISVDEGKRAKD